MAKQLDNSFVRFSQHQHAAPLAGLSITIGILLAAGLVWSIFDRQWPSVALFAFSLIGVVVFSFLSTRTTRKLAAAHDEARIDWESALPEVQRESLNIEVVELSRILEVRNEQISDLQSAYIVAEDLALRQIQQEEQVPLLRHVSIGGVPFDAVLVKQDTIICAEASFLVAPELRQERIDSMMKKMARVRVVVEDMKVAMKIRLMVILVTQLTFEDEERLRKSLSTRRFAGTPVDVDIRLLDFEALQRIYVTD
ncbi:MAG: hypothetical protein DMF63_17815 [Acidobacteria bacterium]|nr:MAG: hypothetical protein DMF63_17815 [Acidobacteriota bacterium]